MSDRREPLSKHTKFDYYECYAKIVLEELYPEEFKNLEVKDKPDLQMEDRNSGVEVTNAEDSDQLNAERIYTDISYNRINNIEKALKKIMECGCRLEGGILVGKPGSDTFDLILKAFDNKLIKLNNGKYKYFEKNYLFIFSDIYANDMMIIKAIQEMQEKQTNMAIQFHKVFVLVPEYCYMLDLYTGSYEKNEIEDSRQHVQAMKARELVEEYENLNLL